MLSEIEKLPKLPETSGNSEGLQIIEKDYGYTTIELQDIFNKINVQYNKETDTFLLNIDSNLVIKSSNFIVNSSKDIVLLSGEAQGLTGKIHLNPILQKFRKIKNFFVKSPK